MGGKSRPGAGSGGLLPLSEPASGPDHDGGGVQLECIATPGHTPGHMCFWIEEQGIMFLGDHILFDITPNITAWSGWRIPWAITSDPWTDPQISHPDPLPAHRGVAGDVKARTGMAAHHIARLGEALTIVQNEPGLTAYEIAGRMRWRIRARTGMNSRGAEVVCRGEAMAHLDHLAAGGHVERRIRDKVGIYFAIK